MKILVILRNIYSNPDVFDNEQYLCKSDCNILAEAMMLKEQCGGQVTALLFGEKVEENVKTLQKACTYGADEGALIGFHDFDFSDTEAFAKVIARTIETEYADYSLILFGRLAYDGDAVNLATQVACHLSCARVVYSREINIKEGKICARKYLSSSEEVICQVDADKVLIQSIREHGVTRQPKISDIIRTYNGLEITQINGDAIAAKIPENNTGFRLFKKTEPEENTEKKMVLLNGKNDEESSVNLLNLLQKSGFQGKKI